MIFFILLGVTATISALMWWFTRNSRFSSTDWIWVAVFGAVFSFIIAGIGGTASVTYNEDNFVSKTSGYQKLSALKDGKEVSGSFFLLSGGFGSESKYSYIVTDNDGVSRVQSLDISRAGVKEDGKRVLETITKTYESNFWFPGVSMTSTDYVFHIPAGSMTTEFTVDME